MEHHNKERAEFIRITEIESYYSQQRIPDITIIALALFVSSAVEQTASGLLLALSLIKLVALLIFSIIERKFYENGSALIGTRSIQFWVYRFIFFIQLILLTVIVIAMSSSSSSSSQSTSK